MELWKALVKFFANFIPNSELRRKIRKIFIRLPVLINCIYSLIKFKYFVNKDKVNNFAIVLIIKDEACYLQEWIEYHMLLGCKKFYIYDNESTDNIKEILKKYIELGIVKYKFYPGAKIQLNAYEHAIKKNKYKEKWLCFIDIDEFIVLKDGKTINDVLKDFDGNQ